MNGMEKYQLVWLHSELNFYQKMWIKSNISNHLKTVLCSSALWDTHISSWVPVASLTYNGERIFQIHTWLVGLLSTLKILAINDSFINLTFKIYIFHCDFIHGHGMFHAHLRLKQNLSSMENPSPFAKGKGPPSSSRVHCQACNKNNHIAE